MFHAIALDRRLDVSGLEPSARGVAVTHRSLQRLRLDVGTTQAWLFAWGSLVYRANSRDLDLERRVSAWSHAEPLEETYEDLAVNVGADELRVDWRAVWLPENGPELDDVLALLLARSVGLDRYERRARPLLRDGASALRRLARDGRPTRAIADLVQRLAGLSESRIELAQWFVHLDRPEATWTDPTADKLYGLLSDHLELRERQQLLSQQFGALEAGLGRILSLWEGRRARGLEWAILVLILVEVLMALWPT